MQYDVFISYSSKDKEITNRVCAYLEESKIRCFVAYRDIPRGKVWAAEIVEAIENSRMLLVLFSKHFNSSHQVDREIELAVERGIPILTFRLSDDVFVGAKKYYLTNINWIDAFPTPELHFRVLKENVLNLLKKGKTSFPKDRTPISAQLPTRATSKSPKCHLKDKCAEFLRKEGYFPTIDSDGDVMFKVQGATVFLIDDERDSTFLKIWLPNFWSLDSDKERAKAHFITNKLNTEYKCGKIFLHDDNTHAVCELFIDANSSILKETLARCIGILASMKDEFKELMQSPKDLSLLKNEMESAES